MGKHKAVEKVHPLSKAQKLGKHKAVQKVHPLSKAQKLGKHKTVQKEQPQSKAWKLMCNPVEVGKDEFVESFLDEMTNCKLVVTKEKGPPVLQDWTVKNGKVGV